MEIIEHKKELMRKIKQAKTIFIMGHKDLDLDALGSCIGMYLLLQSKRKKAYIIVDDTEHELGVNKVLIELDGCIQIIHSDDIHKYLHPNEKKNLLIILDTTKENLVQSKKALEIKDKVIIDHHEKGKSTITKCLMINDTKSSSTCEMITELMMNQDLEIEPYYATILLSGIVLDTNNFTLKTSEETFYTAYYLTCLGASAKKVQYLLKQDLDDYTERQKLLTDIRTIHKNIAVTKATPYTIYRREDLAKVADTLLYFNNIEASFVIGKIDKNTVGISARSLGNYNINKIMTKLGGGGDNYNGAAKFENVTISKVEEELNKVLKEEGD